MDIITNQLDILSDPEKDKTLSEELVVLTSIYPEIQLLNQNKALSLVLPIIPEKSIKLILNSTENFTNFLYTTGLNFYAEIPITKQNYLLIANWIPEQILSKFRDKINEIINNNSDFCLYEIIDYLKTDVTESSIEIENICQNYEIIVSSQEKYDELNEIFNTAKLNNFSTSRFLCSICLETKEGINGVILPNCEHKFCQNCLSSYFENIINNDDVLKLQCPNCPIETFTHLGSLSLSKLSQKLFEREFPRHILSQIGLSTTTIDKYINLLTNSIFEKIQIHYPFATSLCPRCNHWIMREDLDDQLVQCRRCNFNYCILCEHSWHGTFNSCGKKLNSIPEDILLEILDDLQNIELRETYESKYGKKHLSNNLRDFQSELAFKEYLNLSEDIVKCPSCSMAISKTDGCNKMKCTSCTNSFCYLCLELLDKTNPYVHYTTQRGSLCTGRLFEGLMGSD